ncbi:M15 family metallopeptidase [Cellulomonas sp. ICMP 17802]|uniref:M15 family metallopeptidase n=1 Tax=Cellulomonas sp. ICMP 17802 TaxID=3239199 RepID=UPI00351BD985
MAALAVSMCAIVAATANAEDGGSAFIASPTATAGAQVKQARVGAVHVASDAIEVAKTVQTEAAQAQVDAAQLAELQAATAHLDELVAAATADDPTIDRGAATSRTADRAETPAATETPAADQPTAAASPEASPDPASVFETTAAPAQVPTIPPTTGKEDATTAELREAVATVATLATTVRQSAEAKKAADAAAAKAAADAQAAADAAAAAQAQAEADKVAQRAAWKKSLQGYANGKIPESALCGVSFDASVRLRCDAAEQLEVLNTAFKAKFGSNLVVNDSYRSYAGQILCKQTKGYLCATPGTSNHGSGIAVDLGGGIDSFGTAQHRWMDANASALQWVHPSWAERGGSKPEAWHWEYSG